MYTVYAQPYALWLIHIEVRERESAYAVTPQGENANGSNEEVDQSRREKGRHEVYAYTQKIHSKRNCPRAVWPQVGISAQEFHSDQVACDREETRQQSESEHPQPQQSQRSCYSQS